MTSRLPRKSKLKATQELIYNETKFNYAKTRIESDRIEKHKDIHLASGETKKLMIG